MSADTISKNPKALIIPIIMMINKMAEGEWHKKVRLERIEKYRKKGYEVKSSHGNGKISLYLGKPCRSTFLSDADIVLLKDDKIMIIEEIQSTCSPKQAVGIVIATDLCDTCKVDKKLYELSNVKLVIAYKKQKEKSKKPEQLQLINNNLKLDGYLSSFKFEEIV